jgi:hypothetical protein
MGFPRTTSTNPWSAESIVTIPGVSQKVVFWALRVYYEIQHRG